MTPYQQFVALDRTGQYDVDRQVFQFASLEDYDQWQTRRQLSSLLITPGSSES
jgi:hypothetical protein